MVTDVKFIITIVIKEHWAGNYRIEYDGKYITLYGKDKNYKVFNFNENDKEDYEEMILVPIVEEVRNVEPKIVRVTDKEIIISLD